MVKENNLNLKNHEKYLRKDLFLTDTKWPQYNLLFEDIKRLAKIFKKKQKNNFFGKKFTLRWQ